MVLTIAPFSHVAPDFQRLLLGLFLLAADVGNHVVQNLRHGLKGLAGAGNGLVGAGQHLGHAQIQQGMDGGHIALQRAVALYGDKAPLGAQALALGLDDGHVVRVDFRDNHGHVGGGAVGAVVGDHRALVAGVQLLQGADFLLLHVHGAEHEIHQRDDFLNVLFRVVHRHLGQSGRQGAFSWPSGFPPLPRKSARRNGRWRPGPPP